MFWASSNSDVVDVDPEGVLTANKVGKATITAEVGGVKAKCSVEVTPSYIEVSSVELDKSVTWITSDQSVAT